MRWFRKLLPYLVSIVATIVLAYLPDLGPESYTNFDDLFSRERLRQMNPGYSVVIVKRGRVLYHKSFGKDGLKQPLDEDTPMYLGPSSEVLSGALLSSLARTGELNLDKDLSFYLPSPGRRDGRPDPQEKAGVSLRELASYSANIDQPSFAEYRSKTLGLEAGELDPGLLIRSRFQKGRIPRSRLVYRILGSVMEKATNTSFDELLQARLLIPLGMHGTTSRPDSLQGVAIGSGLFFGLAFPYESRVPLIAAPADGIVTTAGDMTKFLSYITAPPYLRQALGGSVQLSVSSLHEPLLPKAEQSFGWRIPTQGKRSMVYQGGSVEGFCSRVVLWPDDEAAMAILCSQGGAIQSNVVLPLLTTAAEEILFSGSTPRLPPLGRMLVLLGIVLLVYLLSIFFQTLTALSWAKALLARRESGKGALYLGLVLARTILGILGRAGLLVALPLLASFVVGASLGYRDLMVMDPGLATFLILVALIGCLRNSVRLVWYIHLTRG